MSKWAKRRKIYIQITILLIMASTALLIIFDVVNKKPTCLDGVQNGNELGVDCGGACAQVCVSTIKDLVTVWTQTFELNNGIYSAVAYIENQNKDLYIPKVQFEMSFFNEDGLFLNRASNYTTIMPNGVTAVYVPYILTKEQKIESSLIDFVEDIKFEKFEQTFDVEIFEEKFDSGNKYTNPTASAIVKNEGNEELKNVKFVVILYDKGGNAVASSSTFLETLDINETKNINYTWINLFQSEPVRMEVIPLL